MTVTEYTWTDNPTVSGISPCDTDILNDNLMHLKYNNKSLNTPQYTINSGNQDILTINADTLTFNVNNEKPLTITFKDSTTTFTTLPSVNVSTIANGTYVIFIKNDGTTELATNLNIQTQQPALPTTNLVWRNILELPIVQTKYNGTTWEDYDAVDCGQITITSGLISSFEQPCFNSNGFSIFNTKNNRKFVSSWIMPDYNAGINITSILNNYTIPSDGFLDVGITGESSSSNNLYVNGQLICKGLSTYGSYLPVISGQFRVQKNDVITCSGYIVLAIFFPIKGAS